MLLCVDIGNTNVVLGLWEKGRWVAHWRVRTIRDKMPDEYNILLKALLNDGGFQWQDVTRVAMASVVPPLTPVFRELFSRYLGSEPLSVGPGIRTGLRIRTDNPVELGADLVANAVAAYQRFHRACVIVDFGTATTFSALSEEGDFLGVAIAPGLDVAADALVSHTSQLLRVALVPPATAIGKNTVHSMQAGLVLGYVGLVEGMIRRIRAELGGQAEVVATGGLSAVLAPLTQEIEHVDPWLTLEGLRLISDMNQG